MRKGTGTAKRQSRSEEAVQRGEPRDEEPGACAPQNVQADVAVQVNVGVVDLAWHGRNEGALGAGGQRAWHRVRAMLPGRAARSPARAAHLGVAVDRRRLVWVVLGDFEGEDKAAVLVEAL